MAFNPVSWLFRSHEANHHPSEPVHFEAHQQEASSVSAQIIRIAAIAGSILVTGLSSFAFLATGAPIAGVTAITFGIISIILLSNEVPDDSASALSPRRPHERTHHVFYHTNPHANSSSFTREEPFRSPVNHSSYYSSSRPSAPIYPDITPALSSGDERVQVGDHSSVDRSSSSGSIWRRPSQQITPHYTPPYAPAHNAGVPDYNARATTGDERVQVEDHSTVQQQQEEERGDERVQVGKKKSQ